MTNKKHSDAQPTHEETAKKPAINWTMVAVVAALAGVLLLVRSFTGKTDEFKNKIIPDAVKKIVTDPAAKIEVSNVKDSSGVYQFDLKVNGQAYVSYITKDGKILFTSGIALDDKANKNSATSEQQKKLTCNDLKKADKPKLTAFVMSQCPYGLQMQRVFKNAINEDPTLADKLDIKYIGSIENGKITAMRGDAEAQENLKQICIREEQKQLYWPYVSCYMQEGKTDQCLANVGVDQITMNACMQDPARGNAYAQKDFDLANKFSVGGSPTLLLNEKQIVSEFDFGGRTPNAVKQLTCCGSSKKDASCATEISTKDIVPGYSITDITSGTGGSSSSAAGCGPAQPAS